MENKEQAVNGAGQVNAAGAAVPAAGPVPPVPQAAVESRENPEVHPVEFATLERPGQVKPEVNLNVLMDVNLRISVEVGRTRMMVRDLLKLGPGSVIELDKLTNEPVDILVNDKPFARGEIVIVEDNFGVRITEIASPAERMNSIK
jgi:flagellar motor switch protein FliN/FliY